MIGFDQASSAEEFLFGSCSLERLGAGLASGVLLDGDERDANYGWHGVGQLSGGWC